ncbi:MAG: 30S ribosomal protein S19 [Candidatus Woesearchaeota archaeon]
MAKKEFIYRGKKIDELKAMSVEDLAKLLPARERRKILARGFTEQEKTFLKDVASGSKNIKTHCRDMIVLPNMVGLTIKIHNGKTFVDTIIVESMIGHRLGELALTRSKVKHGSVGVVSAIKH